jgi:cyclic di-GMP phosphodiesterase
MRPAGVMRLAPVMRPAAVMRLAPVMRPEVVMSPYTGTQILVVDDDDQVRRIVTRILTSGGYECGSASTVAEARAELEVLAYPLVLCDVGMPGESGLELVASLQDQASTTAVVMISGHDDPTIASLASSRGAYGYLVKPFTSNEILITVENALHRRQLELEVLDSQRLLEATVAQRTEELSDALDEITRSRLEVVRRLSRAVEQRDLDTGFHIERIAELSAMLAEAMHLPRERVELIRVAAPMHDVGKLGIPDSILRKAGPLTETERAQMQRHAEVGHKILSGSNIEMLDVAATIAYTHHERWDGEGYPRGLAGEEIPLEGRIVAVVDVYDALSSDRVYRRALSSEVALRAVARGGGAHFDPAIAGLLEHVVASWRRVEASVA